MKPTDTELPRMRMLDRMRMLGTDTAYDGKGDGPYWVEKLAHENRYWIKIERHQVNLAVLYITPTDWGVDTASTARALCWLLNERERLRREPSPLADYQPGGEVYDAIAQEDRLDAERETEARDE